MAAVATYSTPQVVRYAPQSAVAAGTPTVAASGVVGSLPPTTVTAAPVQGPTVVTYAGTTTTYAAAGATGATYAAGTPPVTYEPATSSYAPATPTAVPYVGGQTAYDPSGSA